MDRAAKLRAEAEEHDLCSSCAARPQRGELCHRALCASCHYDYHRWKRLEAVYDLSQEDYETILTHQRGVCAIDGCEKTTSHKGAAPLSVDHDHRTGLVRGLLCFYHNRMLGHMTPELVAALNAYLQDPPATHALGREFYTTPGAAGTKKRRKLRRRPR